MFLTILINLSLPLQQEVVLSAEHDDVYRDVSKTAQYLQVSSIL